MREAVAAALDRLAPRLPRFERLAILDHAAASTGLRKASPEEAAWLSLVAFARHEMTEYDQMLAEGYDPESARYSVADQMRSVLSRWGVRRML